MVDLIIVFINIEIFFFKLYQSLTDINKRKLCTMYVVQMYSMFQEIRYIILYIIYYTHMLVYIVGFLL